MTKLTQEDMDEQAAPALGIGFSAYFAANDQTMATNAPQRSTASGATADSYDVRYRAMTSLLNSKRALSAKDVPVAVLDCSNPKHPDGPFPNSVITMSGKHIVQRPGMPEINPQGRYALGTPMYHDNRQGERDPFCEQLSREFNYVVIRHGVFKRALEEYEAERIEKRQAFEGTGSWAAHRGLLKAYTAISKRTDPELVEDIKRATVHQTTSFGTFDDTYHTDLIVFCGSEMQAACLEVMSDGVDDVRNSMRQDPIEFFDFSAALQSAYCLNMVEVRDIRGGKHVFMSSTSLNAFEGDREGRRFLDFLKKKNIGIIHADLSVFEKEGGGSACCTKQRLDGLTDREMLMRILSTNYDYFWEREGFFSTPYANLVLNPAA